MSRDRQLGVRSVLERASYSLWSTVEGSVHIPPSALPLLALEIGKLLGRWSNNATGYPPSHSGRCDVVVGPLKTRMLVRLRGSSLRFPNEVLGTMAPLKSNWNGIVKGIEIIAYQLRANWVVTVGRCDATLHPRGKLHRFAKQLTCLLCG